MPTEDRDDIKRALVRHQPDGEAYIVEYCSVWEGEQIVGTRIIASVGPLSVPEDLGVEGPLEPSAELFDRIADAVNLDTEDAEWLQAAEDAGRLTYPIGVR